MSIRKQHTLLAVLPPWCKSSLPLLLHNAFGARSCEPSQTGKESWRERMVWTVSCYLVHLSILLLDSQLRGQETSARGSALLLLCVVRKRKHSASSCLIGDSANWRSLLWSPVTSWQTKQSGLKLKLISRVGHSFISVITGCAEREAARKGAAAVEVGTALLPQHQGHAVR